MATYSEDGQWMWNGSEWIPAPPSIPGPVGPPMQKPAEVEKFDVNAALAIGGPSGPPSPRVQIQDSVIGGDFNLTPQVHHHHNQQIVQNNIVNQSIHPMEDFSEVVDKAYESGRRALISLGFFVLFLIVGYSIGLFFSHPPDCYYDYPIQPGCDYDPEAFYAEDYYAGFLIVATVIWLVNGIYIFVQGGSINSFSRIREQYPASPRLEKGDKGKNLHDIAKYLWLAPLVIIIIAIIIGIIVMKIMAEMEKYQKR